MILIPLVYRSVLVTLLVLLALSHFAAVTDGLNDGTISGDNGLTAAAAVTRDDGAGDLTKEYCEANYGRAFNANPKKPALLYSFPGSGNTWVRLLIEYGTGVYSGSLYSDIALKAALPAEFICNFRVSVVKGHPHTHTAESLFETGFFSDFEKCRKGKVLKFDRAVLLIRNPFDSIWSEYQRRLSQNHVGGIKEDGFDWVRWGANAGQLSHRYLDMWERQYAFIFRELAPHNIHVLRYEDLVTPGPVRENALRDVLLFLNITAPSNSEVSPERVRCAFIMGENSRAKRSKSGAVPLSEPSDLYRRNGVRRPVLDRGDGSSSVTAGADVAAAVAEEVSSALPAPAVRLMTKDKAMHVAIVCRMWALFGEYAGKSGYKPYGDFDCDGYAEIENFRLSNMNEYGSNSPWTKGVANRGNRAMLDYTANKPKDFVIGPVNLRKGANSKVRIK